MQVTAYVALGTNLGRLKENLDEALKRLADKGLKITKVSTYIDTDPYGVTDQPRFLNAACEVQTELSAQALLKMLLETELEMGRVRLRHWGERVIDLDLIFYGDAVINEPDLIVPHPDMQNRDFVLTLLCRTPICRTAILCCARWQRLRRINSTRCCTKPWRSCGRNIYKRRNNNELRT